MDGLIECSVVRTSLLASLGGELAERIAVGLEAAAVDVHEDRVRDGHRAVVGVLGAHDRAELRTLADGRHDHVGVALEVEGDLLVELHGRVREPVGSRLSREVERLGRAAVEEDLDAVHVEPVRALDPDLQRRLAARRGEVVARDRLGPRTRRRRGARPP